MLLRAEKIGYIELHIQTLRVMLEQAETQLALEKAIIQVKLRKSAGLAPVESVPQQEAVNSSAEDE